jgi:hypothetical protein
MSSRNVHVTLVRFQSNFNFLDRFSINPPLSNFMKIFQVGAKLFHADVQADTTKLIVACHNFVYVPENAASAAVVGCRRIK